MVRRPFQRSPFLRSIEVHTDAVNSGTYLDSIPAFRGGVSVSIESEVTIIVGENGSGKSTLLEGIASQCGFNLLGGNRNHRYGTELASPLSPFLRLRWLPKLTQGFFLRAESFFNFSTYLDALTKDDPGLLSAYGGRALTEQSHGEGFLAFFQARLQSPGIYLLDEPEAALSPQRQLALLILLERLRRSGIGQVIMATHSPMLMAYPGAEVIEIGESGLRRAAYGELSHFALMKDFLNNPEYMLSVLFHDL